MHGDLLPGENCTSFSANVGVDDEVGDRGSVAFEVYGDDRKLSGSAVLRGVDGSVTVQADVTGVHSLRLVTTNGGDHIDYDHADWANARLSCGTIPPPSLTTQTVTVPASLRTAPFDQTRTLNVPAGSRIAVVARVPAARFLLTLPNGDLLVSQPSQGRVIRLQPGASPADAKASSVLLDGLSALTTSSSPPREPRRTCTSARPTASGAIPSATAYPTLRPGRPSLPGSRRQPARAAGQLRSRAQEHCHRRKHPLRVHRLGDER
ncbi:NPCBM/NEW2 domain-containing protein [Deinococcus malanensis]|uniref:NPCBM/NEW2 domain-containing protein n=1 Tax=Deinococcus malanensis TaxID=1706855 RepID=UPI00362AE8F8